jgi:hypothetical protein
LGFLYLLAIMIDTAINIYMQIFAWIYVFSFPGCIPLTGRSGPHAELCAVFRGTSQWLHHFLSPPAVSEGSNFSTSSTLAIICLFDYCHPRCEVVWSPI